MSVAESAVRKLCAGGWMGLMLAVWGGGGAAWAGQGESASTLIRGATVVDGTGAPGRGVDVRLRGTRIEALGELSPLPGESVIDAAGMTLTPGFIDSHSHHDAGASAEPTLIAAVSQGITTIVIGQDGSSQYPLADYFAALREKPLSVNVASFVGHNTLREVVLGNDARRPASKTEVAAMSALVRSEIESGALGLSTGLEYDTGIYSETSELIELARAAAAHGGRYASHIRSEDREFWRALDEAIDIGEAANIPVHISHIKLAMRSLWNRAPEVIERLEAARARGIEISADVYPYEYWMSTMAVLLPERNFADREAVEFVLRELAPPETLYLVQYRPNPALEGKTITQIASAAGENPVDTYVRLLVRAAETSDEDDLPLPYIVATSMIEADITTFLTWPYTNVCSDGGTFGHPRGHGAFPRVLKNHVRNNPHLTLEEAVRKMTSLAAANVGLENRGKILPGYPADLVLLDPAVVSDNATIADPSALADGIALVWVNGEIVYRDGRTSGALPGRVLLKP